MSRSSSRRSLLGVGGAFGIAFAAVLAALLSAAAIPTAGSPVDAPGGLLRLIWWLDAGFPSPFAFSTVGPGGVVRTSLIYDTLTWKDARGVIPWLAQSWSIEEGGRRVRFVLRAGAVWHDGRPVTAADVAFSFQYYRAHPFLWTDTSIVESATVESPSVVVLRLREPFAPFLETIAGVVPIIPAHVWQTVTDPRRAQSLEMAVGSGPYRLADYRPGSGDYRFIANPRYFRGAPKYAEIRYSLVPLERHVLAVQSGQADAGLADTYDVVPAFAGHPYIRVWQTEPLSIVRLVFNLDRAPLDRVEVRRAIAHGINRPAMAALVTRGPGIPGNPALVPPGDPWHAPRVRAYPFDPARARALLRERGAGPIELLASPSPATTLLEQMLRDAGLEVTLRAVDPQTRASLLAEGRFQVALAGHIGAGGDPDYLRRWLIGEEANLFGRGTVFRHPEYLRLAALQARALDPLLRRRLVQRMQAILADELPTLPLYHRRFYWTYDSRRFEPVASRGGLMNGIPLVENKLALIRP